MHRSQLGLASTGEFETGGGDEPNLMRIQTQVLNKRPSPRLAGIVNQMRGATGQMLVENLDEIERYSLAVDMRTMQDMH